MSSDTAKSSELRTRPVFITGGTGYMGQSLITALTARGHQVRALVRRSSEQRSEQCPEHRLHPGCTPVVGNALDAATYSASVRPCDTFVHLVGVSHPSPAKAEQFRTIDQVSLEAAVAAATEARVSHFVYVSVAQPAPVMRVYQEVRAACERTIRASGMNATILRPWYVLGPGHRWPYALIPFYWIMEQVPKFREGARRLGLVTLQQMIQALQAAVENPATGVQVLDVPAIRAAGRNLSVET